MKLLSSLGLQVPLGHFIDNEFRPSRSGKEFVSTNPATGAAIAKVARGGRDDIEEAVAAAERAMQEGSWSGMNRADRAVILKKIAAGILEKRELLAELESMDTGKPFAETFDGDIMRAVKNFEFYANLLLNDQSERVFINDDGSAHHAAREPLGVCGLITPWNLPLYLATWKIAPALAMGNSVVLKPAELTPMSAAALGVICRDAGLPRGVLNIVQGFGENEAGAALVTAKGVSAISFTGETTTGRSIMKAAADGLKKVSFELGGKGASVVFKDADIDTAIPVVIKAAFRNQGQVCLAGSRLLLHEAIAAEFIERLIPQVRQIKVGDPMAKDTVMGSLISKDHRDRVMNYVRLAEREGAHVLCGGIIPTNTTKEGAFFAPTLITNLKQDSRLIQEEIFGPVLTIQTFKTMDEAVAMVNGTIYGLSASVWSTDDETLREFAQRARCGLVWQNSWFIRNLAAPFGGMKASGIGREGGTFSFDFYCQWKTVIRPTAIVTKGS